MSKIQQSIEKLLQKHRILLWYDVEYLYKNEMELNDSTRVKYNLFGQAVEKIKSVNDKKKKKKVKDFDWIDGGRIR